MAESSKNGVAPSQPHFTRRMIALEKHLAAEGKEPFGRPFRVEVLIDPIYSIGFVLNESKDRGWFIDQRFSQTDEYVVFIFLMPSITPGHLLAVVSRAWARTSCSQHCLPVFCSTT